MADVGAVEASGKFNAKAKAMQWPSLCDPTLSFAEPDFTCLTGIWKQAAVQGRLPYRRELDLRKLKSMLPLLALYERLFGEQTRYRVRVMDTSFAEALGDLSGQLLDGAVAPEHLARWRAALDAAFEAAAPLRFIGQLDVSDKPYMLAEYFEAPLLSDDGMPSFVVAAAHFRAGDWRQVSSTEMKRLNLAVFG